MIHVTASRPGLPIQIAMRATLVGIRAKHRLSMMRSLTRARRAARATLAARPIDSRCAALLTQGQALGGVPPAKEMRRSRDLSGGHLAAETAPTLTSGDALRESHAGRVILMPSVQIVACGVQKDARAGLGHAPGLIGSLGCAPGGLVGQEKLLRGAEPPLRADSTGAIATARCWASCSLPGLVASAWGFLASEGIVLMSPCCWLAFLPCWSVWAAPPSTCTSELLCARLGERTTGGPARRLALLCCARCLPYLVLVPRIEALCSSAKDRW